MTSDNHSRYEELAALAAGGFLSVEEVEEFAEHIQSCAECQQVKAEFAAIVLSGLPLTEGALHQRLGEPFRAVETGASAATREAPCQAAQKAVLVRQPGRRERRPRV